MVWLNAVSNTPTIRMSGISSRQAATPTRLAGLCRGARSLHSVMAWITSPVITTEPVNFSPPWTSRCPTTSISEKSFSTPRSGSTSIFNNTPTAALWSGMSTGSFREIPPSVR